MYSSRFFWLHLRSILFAIGREKKTKKNSMRRYRRSGTCNCQLPLNIVYVHYFWAMDVRRLRSGIMLKLCTLEFICKYYTQLSLGYIFVFSASTAPHRIAGPNHFFPRPGALWRIFPIRKIVRTQFVACWYSQTKKSCTLTVYGTFTWRLPWLALPHDHND